MENSKRSLQKVKAHLNAAKAYAELSYAKRLKVGCVIIRDDRVISIGFNGTPSGRDNNCETEEIGNYGFLGEHKTGNLVTKPEVVHAECNAIMFAAKQGTSTDSCSMIITHSPCFECSKMIVQCGIKELYYDEEYRDTQPLDFLRECGIKVEKIHG